MPFAVPKPTGALEDASRAALMSCHTLRASSREVGPGQPPVQECYERQAACVVSASQKSPGISVTQPPSLAQIADQLRGLISGALDRREASAWAAHWLTADDPGVEDDVAWQALERIGGADLPGNETKYLFHEADFHTWLDDVEDAIDARS